MAQQIRMELPPRDARVVLQDRLENAPLEHAEALLAGYEVLQGLHDNGVLEVLRGVLGSSGEVLEILVETAQSPQSIRSIRNLILLVNMLGDIDPQQLKTVVSTIPEALKSATEQPETPGLWKLSLELLRNKDARRGLSALNKMLETFGRKLAAK